MDKQNQTQERNDSSEQSEAEKSVKNYLNMLRWQRTGPARATMTPDERDYILCLGAYLSKDCQLGARELSGLFGKSQSSVSGSLDRLENEGFIERKPCDKDTRRNLLQLTEKGMACYKGLSEVLYRNSKFCPIDFMGSV